MFNFHGNLGIFMIFKALLEKQTYMSYKFFLTMFESVEKIKINIQKYFSLHTEEFKMNS